VYGPPVNVTHKQWTRSWSMLNWTVQLSGFQSYLGGLIIQSMDTQHSLCND